MEDRELREEYRKRTLVRVEKFADELKDAFKELFAEIRKQTGLPDLTFELTFGTDRDTGFPRPSFKSQDLVDKLGFIHLMFEELVISDFNSRIVVDQPNYKEIDYNEDYPIYYWCTVDFSYTHPGGGSNGKQWMRAVYRNGSWEFELDKK